MIVVSEFANWLEGESAFPFGFKYHLGALYLSTLPVDLLQS